MQRIKKMKKFINEKTQNIQIILIIVEVARF